MTVLRVCPYCGMPVGTTPGRPAMSWYDAGRHRITVDCTSCDRPVDVKPIVYGIHRDLKILRAARTVDDLLAALPRRPNREIP